MEHSTHVEKQEAKLRFVGENTFIKHQQWRSNIRIEYRWFKEFFLSLSHKKQELTFITGIKQNSVAYNLSCYFSHQNLDLKISKTEFTVHTCVQKQKWSSATKPKVVMLNCENNITRNYSPGTKNTFINMHITKEYR